MGELESKPAIHIHLNQQVTIEAIRGQEEVEDATVATEITGFDVEEDLYVLRGALSFTGFLRQDDPAQRQAPIPDAFDDRDVFDTAEEVAEAPVLPFHYRLPFVLQVPVAAQQSHQREAGILSVNPRIGQWNVHVLGERTVHLRAELIIQGLSGADGYVFRCGSQEEGAGANKLDHLLDKEEARTYSPPQAEANVGEEFEAPFEPWQPDADALQENTLYAQQRGLHELADSASQEDDWMIETPDDRAEQAAQDTQEKDTGFQAEEAEEEDENQVIFTPDPTLVFPMPDPNSVWARELEAADRAFGEQVRQMPFLSRAPFSPSVNAFDAPEQREHQADAAAEEDAFDAVSDEDAFVVETPEEVRAEQERTFDVATERVDARAREEVAARAEAEEVTQEWRTEAAQTPQESRTEAEEGQAFEVPTGVSIEADDTVEARRDETIFAQSETAEEAQVNAAAESFAVSQTQTDAEAQQDEVERIEETQEPSVVEYLFEDEVPPQETPTELVQEASPKSFAPKLSLGSKSSTVNANEPIKLSQLLGDSRTEVPAAPLEPSAFGSPSIGSASFAEAAQLVRESLSYAELNTMVEANDAAEEEVLQPMTLSESASIVTSSKGHGNDSFWREILSGHEEKVTMKFRIVQEDESLPELAEHYHTTINELLRANNLQRQEVDAGQILYIPARRR